MSGKRLSPLFAVRVAATASLVLSLTAGAAIALAPPLPYCEPEPGSEEAARWDGGTEFWFITETFVEVTGYLADGSGVVRIVEHCPTATRLELVLPFDADTGDLSTRLREMVQGEAPYTLEQMAAGLTAIGGDARVVKVSYQSCACADALAGEAD